MKKLNQLAFSVAAFAVTLGLSGGGVLAGTVGSAQGHTYTANLSALNKSADTGNSTVTMVSNGNGSFTVKTTGVSPNLAHAQHIHIGGTNSCPTISADKDKDGLINTTEGEPSYGPIEISLTTAGDTSKDSGLAVDRFPVANADGTVTYERTFALPTGVTEEMISKGVVVTHGVSEITGDKAKYDGEKKSDIPKSEALPLEATIPAACGKLVSSPAGGVDAGEGSSAGTENVLSFAAGGTALAAAAYMLIQRQQKTNRNNL